MAEIVNLRTRRKQAARDAARAEAAATAATSGRSRAERDLAAARAEQAARRLDGHRRVPPGTGPALETGPGPDPADPRAPHPIRGPGRSDC
jgi:hypothetical protein